MLESRPAGSSFNCLDGIRIISFLQIVFFHIFTDGLATAVFLQPAQRTTLTEKLFHVLPASGFIAVETFLIISGLLLSYQFMTSRQSGTNFNVLEFYIRRSMRLLPSMFFMQWIFVAYGQQINGPDTSQLQTLLANYNMNPFWTLFVGHPYGHLWYIAVEFRLCLIAPALLFGLWRWGYKFFLLLVFGVAASTGYQLYLPLVGVSPIFSARSRCGPWLVGLMLGYVLYREKNRKWVLPRGLLFLIIVMCLIGMGKVSTNGLVYRLDES